MNDEMKTRMVRMAADIFIPVGERQALVDSLYQLVEDASTAKEMALQAQSDLQAIKNGIAVLLSVANNNQPKIDQTVEDVEVAAVESSIAADNTDTILTEG